MYFSPEIKENDPPFYNQATYYMSIYAQMPLISKNVFNFHKDDFINHLLPNDFELLRKYRDDAHTSENPLFEAIYHDDLEKLQLFLSSPKMNGNEIITHSIISPYREIANRLSLISTAAVFSSVKCFKYLLLNGFEIDTISSEAGSLAQDTIVGGNLEIIRFAQQNHVDFDGSLTTCANYFRNEIFEWLFEIFGNDVNALTKKSPTGSTVFCQACRLGNVELALKCIDLGVDLNARDIDSSPISQASFGGCHDIFDLLFSAGFDSKYEDDLNSSRICPSNCERIEVETIDVDINSDDDEDDNDEDDEYDDFEAMDYKLSFSTKFYQFLGIESKIKINSIYGSMREAAYDGQTDCLKVYFDHGLAFDISLITRAIYNSRFSTLSYIMEKVDFVNEESNENDIIMISHCKCYFVDDPENPHFARKDLRIKLNKPLLISNLLKLMFRQNDDRIITLMFQKLSLDINDEKIHNLLLNQDALFTGKNPNSIAFLFMNLNVDNKFKLLEKIPLVSIPIFMHFSFYSDQIIHFLNDYKSKNDINSLSIHLKPFFYYAEIFYSEQSL